MARKLNYNLFGIGSGNMTLGDIEISDLINKLTEKFNLNISKKEIEISYWICPTTNDDDCCTETIDYETYLKRKDSIDDISKYFIPVILTNSKENCEKAEITLTNEGNELENQIKGEINFYGSSESAEKLIGILFNLDDFLNKTYLSNKKEDKKYSSLS